MQVGDSAIRLIAWEPTLLFELRAITACPGPANAYFDPVFVFGFLLGGCGGGCFCVFAAGATVADLGSVRSHICARWNRGEDRKSKN
jgi:hypothetical protein